MTIETTRLKIYTASQRVLEKCGFIPSGIDGEEGPRFVCARYNAGLYSIR